MNIKDHLKSFWSCLGFLSIVPADRQRLLSPEEFGHFPAYYPMVGFVFGLDMFIIWLIASPFIPPKATATLIVAFMIIVNRGFHIDGLADTADALLSHKTREDKLRILKDSRQGSFGVLAIVFSTLLKIEFVALVAPLAPWVLIIWPLWGRLSASVCAVRSNYAGQDEGLGKWMVEKSGWSEIFIAALFTMLISLLGGWQTLLIAHLALFSGILFTKIWKHALGGVTGDLLGATIELVEISTLIIFYILISNQSLLA